MKIQRLVLGKIDNNTYLVSEGDRCIVIDPSNGNRQILETIRQSGFTVEAILITHAHWDHVYSMNEIKAETGAKTYMHKDDLPLLENSMLRINEQTPEIDVLLSGGEELPLIGHTAQVLHTPGHALGCVCYIIDDAMFSGDTLFAGSVGRTDLETSDPAKMEKTLKMLSQIKEDYTLYPGHGDSSTLQFEIAHNPFLQQVK